MITNTALSSMCRACLSQDNASTKFLFSNDLSKMFHICTNLEISEEDGLPSELCSECANRVEAFYLFREQCLNSDLALRQEELLIKEENPPHAEECSATHFEDSNFNEKSSDEEKISSDFAGETKTEDIENLQKVKRKRVFKKKSHASGRYRSNSTNLSHKHKFKCSECPRRFKTEERCERHIKTHFGKEGAECELCSKSFSSSYALEVHMNLHLGKKDFVCFCGKDFFTKYTYEIHSRTHEGEEGRTFVCEKCGKGFYSKANLMGHKMVHMEDTPYKCTECPKAFKNNGSLQAHLVRHSNVRNHICAECGKASVTLAELRIHMRNIHSDLRPFCCEVCGKRCKLRSHLTAHVQIHTGRNKCHTCGKIFATGGTLKIHQRVHTGEKPFTCGICERSFSQKSALKTHMKVHN